MPLTREWWCPYAFTHVMWGTLVAGHVWEEAWSVATCLAWGCLVSFSTAPLLDSSVYSRMRKRRGWSMPLFHTGNVLLHVLPLFWVSWIRPPRTLTLTHGIVAAIIHGTWGGVVSGGTFRLDDVYVVMPATHWYCMWLVAWTTEVMVAVSGRE